MTLSRSEVQKRYREKHRERINTEARERKRARIAAMSPGQKAEWDERIRAENAAYKKANPDYWKHWYQEHRLETKARYDEWRIAHPDRAAAASAKWRAANPERGRARTRRRRALVRGAEGDHQGSWWGRQAYYGGLCWICRSAAGVVPDHVIALCNGGSDWGSNIRPACARCNSQKGRWEMTGKKSLSEILAWAEAKRLFKVKDLR